MDEAGIWSELGEEGFARIVAGFYRRVPADDLLGPMYPPEDFDGAEKRLRDLYDGQGDIIIDDEPTAEKAREFIGQIMPQRPQVVQES